MPTESIIRFAEFELDLSRHELRREGRPIKLERLPFSLLTQLAEAQGRLVTREEIAERLWGRDTFHDTENGINTAIRKIRIALKDDPQQPRVVLTVPGVGYRLAAEVTSQSVEGVPAAPVPTEAGAPPQEKRSLFPARWVWVLAGLAVALALAAVSWRLAAPPVASPVIAVLPLRNLAPAENDYFSDGLTEELIRNLSLIEGLEVKSSTSSYIFKGKARNLREIGQQLGANLLLEGSVRRAEGRLRIDVALVDVAGDVRLWSERYDREAKDVFAIQDEIASAIVDQLRLKLGAVRRRYSTAPENYDSYLRGLALSGTMPSGRDAAKLEEARSLFEEVVALDPAFAPAHAALGQVLARISLGRRTTFEGASERAHAALLEALRLDPLLPEAHATLGQLQAYDLAWERAEASFRRALELDPNLAVARSAYAVFILLPLGRMDEAAHEARRAVHLDPLSSDAWSALALVLYVGERFDETKETGRKILTLQPGNTFAQNLYGRALTQEGRLEEAIALFEGIKDARATRRYLGYAYARAGRRAEAERLAEEPDPALFRQQALIYAGLGDAERTLQALGKMAAERDPAANLFSVTPELAFLRGDPRWKDFRRAQKLPDSLPAQTPR